MLNLWVIKRDGHNLKIIIENTDSTALRKIAMGLYEMGQVTIINESATDQKNLYISDEDIRSAVLQVINYFSVKSQWVAIYRVLVDNYRFPTEIKAFCTRMNHIMDGRCRNFPCSYQSIQKALADKKILRKPYCEWEEYVPKKDERFFQRQKMIAERFFDVLKAS